MSVGARFRTSMIAMTVAAVAISVGLSLGSSSCSYGSYDGSSDAGAVTGATISAAFQPGTEQTVRTVDGTLTLQVPTDAFTAPTTIRIEQVADRDADGLRVPAYSVTSDTPLVGRIGVIFNGSTGGGNGGGPGNSRLIATVDVDGGVATPLLVGGNFGGGPFGIATALGVFSIASRPGRTFSLDLSRAGVTCVERCCNGGANGSNAVAAGASCQCDVGGGGGTSSPNLACFLGCTDLAVAAELCGGHAATITGSITCGPPDGGPNPMGPSQPQTCSPNNGPGNPNSTCCITGGQGNCSNDPSCMGGPGLRVDCTARTDCTDGYECCAFDKEVRCAKGCPQAQRVCRDSADCGGTKCDMGKSCIFGTCGTAPAQCK